MSTAAANSRDFSEICCPCWFSKVPQASQSEESTPGDWANVSLIKRDGSGNDMTRFGLAPKEFVYSLEVSSGDLYGVQHNEIGPDGIERPVVDSKTDVAIKCAAIFIGIPFYMLGVMFVNMVKIAVDVSAVFWRTLPQMIQDFQNKGIIAAFGNMSMDVFWNIPNEVFQDMWRVVRSPLYASGMMLAAAFGVVQPYEGRKWLGSIEQAWHQGVSYKSDLRYQRTAKEYSEVSFTDMVKDIRSGKVWFLGYCMQKRGNINDTVAGVARFKFFDKEPKKAEISSKPLEDGGGTLYTFEVEYNGKTQSVEVEKRGNVAWPRRINLVCSEMPNDACLSQFARDVKTGLGLSHFPSGPIEEVLGDYRSSTKSATHTVQTPRDNEKVHSLVVSYRGVMQKIEIQERRGDFEVKSFEIHPDAFPSIHAKQQFIRDIKKVAGENLLRVNGTDRRALQQIFQDGQMGRLANLRF